MKIKTLKTKINILRTFSKILKYNLSGKKPWSPGYVEARDEVILQEIQKNRKTCKNIGKGFDERVIEIPQLIKFLSNDKKMLWDVGAALNNKKFLLLKKIKNKKIIISNLNPECKNHNYLNVSYLYEDAVFTSLKDKIFDEIVCISTLEHLGFDNSRYDGMFITKIRPKYYLKMIKVFRRKLKTGGRLFITVPFGEAKNHHWFQVFDKNMLQRIVATFKPVKSSLTIFQYKETGWELSDEFKCRLCGVYKINSANGQEINIAGAESVACLEMCI